MTCRFNPADYLERVSNVRFTTTKQRDLHTDGLCCFFDPEGKEKHPVDMSGRLILVAGIIETKDINRPLQDIVRETYSFSHKHIYYPCPCLEFFTTMEEKEAEKSLVLSASCTIYNLGADKLGSDWAWRLERCKEYPGKKDPPEKFCFYEKFSCSPADQKLRAEAVHLLLLAMRKTADNSYLKEFSAGVMKKFLAGWYLIPVPMKKACAQAAN